MEVYDGRIQTLLQSMEKDWGNPVDNREKLVPLGLGIIDEALYGINTVDGDLILIIGEEKNRKTTLVINIIINYMLENVKPITVFDTLESGMPPKKVRDMFLANLASRYLMEDGHKTKMRCDVCNENICRELVLSPDYLRYNTRSPEQQKAIEKAKDAMMGWPLFIFGPDIHEGHTRSLNLSLNRWKQLIKDEKAKIFVVDHIQQYSFDTFLTEYEKQTRVVSVIGDVVSQERVAFITISQVSLTSIREARAGTARIGATGGQKGSQEANVELTVFHRAKDNIMQISITASRRSGLLSVPISIQESSGAIVPYDIQKL